MRAYCAVIALAAAACASSDSNVAQTVMDPGPVSVDVPFSGQEASTDSRRSMGRVLIAPGADGPNAWIDFQVEIPTTGRYRTEVLHPTAQGTLWVEDYVGNPDGRTYDITGPMPIDNLIEVSGQYVAPANLGRDGSPLQAGTHHMRLHSSDGMMLVEGVRFTLLHEHVVTPETLTQRTDGDSWSLVWADEFSGSGIPDPDKWTSDLGNWGWGNREPQYYTEADTDNANQANGFLTITARPNDDGNAWTSARLTTRGKTAFLYGRIDMRAKVPATDGVWAAGWTLGDAYRDEVSWPYCGEIDIMEAVGREIDDTSGDGINHASCHTRAYYFKQGNHISNTLPVRRMAGEFHVYTCEWDQKEVRMYVDGQHYYTYDKHDSDEAWPFDEPQCVILNLAMGGGMGGAIAEDAGPQELVVDYVRIYGRQ